MLDETFSNDPGGQFDYGLLDDEASEPLTALSRKSPQKSPNKHLNLLMSPLPGSCTGHREELTLLLGGRLTLLMHQNDATCMEKNFVGGSATYRVPCTHSSRFEVLQPILIVPNSPRPRRWCLHTLKP